MICLGATTNPSWSDILKTARAQKYPIPQPEKCPYVLLLQANDNQLLVLSPYFQKQKVILYVVEVCAPGLTIIDRQSIPHNIWKEAETLANKLITKSLTTSLTSSINNEPPIN